jgi:hypothetical protein
MTLSYHLTDISRQAAYMVAGDPVGVAAFYQQIPGAQPYSDGYYTFPCNSTLPDISFTIGGRDFPITINIGPSSSDTPNDCLGAILAVPGISFWVLGNRFMANYYTVFDFENAQVGFATLA